MRIHREEIINVILAFFRFSIAAATCCEEQRHRQENKKIIMVITRL
jgi:hypothetical protein